MNKDIKIGIMNQEEPFCLRDIIYRLNEKGISDNTEILLTLDKLYSEGLVHYDRVSKDSNIGNFGFAFFTDNYKSKVKTKIK